MRQSSFATMPKQVKEMYRECAKRGDEQVRQLITQFNAFHRNEDDVNFTAASLSTITARTLIVHGDRDRFFPRLRLTSMAARAGPDSTTRMIGSLFGKSRQVASADQTSCAA